MVDEYMLTEAEISFIKLLETLDKTAQHSSSAFAPNQTERCQHVSDFAVADTDGISLVAQEDSLSKQSADAVSFSSSSSSSTASVLVETPGTQQLDTLVNACSIELKFHPQNDHISASSFAEKGSCHHIAALGQSQAQGPGQHCLREGQCQDPPAEPSKSAFGPSSNPQAHVPLALHSSASSHIPVSLHRSASGVPKTSPSSKGDFSTTLASLNATEASVADSTGEGASKWNSDQQWRAAACTLLCNPRVALQDRDDPGLDSSVDSASEACDDQQEARISNMQMLIVKAKELQASGAKST